MINGHCNKLKIELKVLEINENDNTAYQFLRDKSKRILKKIFIAINAYSKNLEESQTDTLTMHLEKL